jgi:hypothetical protein
MKPDQSIPLSQNTNVGSGDQLLTLVAEMLDGKTSDGGSNLFLTWRPSTLAGVTNARFVVVGHDSSVVLHDSDDPRLSCLAIELGLMLRMTTDDGAVDDEFRGTVQTSYFDLNQQPGFAFTGILSKEALPASTIGRHLLGTRDPDVPGPGAAWPDSLRLFIMFDSLQNHEFGNVAFSKGSDIADLCVGPGPCGSTPGPLPPSTSTVLDGGGDAR